MKKNRCTICGYIHEGETPPDRCPVCDAPASAFEMMENENEFGATNSGTVMSPKTLEGVRDRAREILKGICGVFPACDGDPNRICQREAYGRPIGMGGAGSGSGFKANYRSLSDLRLITRLVGDHFEPDMEFDFFGTKLSMPIIGSSTAGPSRYNNCMTEIDFCRANIQGCIDAGTIAFRGDTSFYTLKYSPALESIREVGGKGVAIFKPRSQDVLFQLIEKAEKLGCIAVGVDLDGCGSTNMAAAGQPVYRKSLKEMKELVAATRLPFIFKGIMCVADAEACVEAGARVVAVSNHGGRVLDSTPGVAEVLPDIAKRVGRDVMVTADGGVRTGYDVFKMLALGADAVLIGRDLVRAAIGGGSVGIRLHMERLKKVLAHVMLMTGCENLRSIGPHVFYGKNV